MKHPTSGFELIKKNRELSLLSAHIAYQHHETINGKGHPRGLSGEEILELPQVCAIANLYENLISNEGYLPHEALEIIMTKNETEYPIKIITGIYEQYPFLHSRNQGATQQPSKSDRHRDQNTPPSPRCTLP